MTAQSVLERTLRRDRVTILTGIVLTTSCAWLYTLAGGGLDVGAHETMGHSMDGMVHAATALPTPAQAGALLGMWWAMMSAMMLPGAAPTILLAAELNRRTHAKRPPFGPTGAFTGGYLLVWLAFSALAVVAQVALQSVQVVSPMLEATSPSFVAGLLIAAGFWQLTPAKRACLAHCRSPVQFLTTHRRPGVAGALVTGIEHGTWCAGCCWVLMLLLFAGGVMNPWWIAGLTVYVLAEKVVSYGEQVARIMGASLLVAGVAVAVSSRCG